MGYESSLHLVDVKIKPASLSEVKRTLGKRKESPKDAFEFFLERAVVDSEGYLEFRASDDGLDPYVPCEEDGTVPALFGKWYDDERIASWLKQHVEEGGQMVLHSIEADGEAWGWEFDGCGRMRPLALCPVEEWQ